MPTTVVEQIATELETRLGNITNVTEVVRATVKGGYKVQNHQVVLAFSDLERVPELSQPGNPPATAWVQRFNVHCHIVQSETATESADELISTMAADAIIAMATSSDVHPWQTFGGLAIDAQFEAQENLESENFDGVNVPIAITFRTDEDNPYTARG